MEKCRGGQKDLEKTCDWVPRVELWHWKSGGAVKHVGVVQDMHEDSGEVWVMMDWWGQMFADDTVMCCQSRDEMEEGVKRCQYQLNTWGIAD